MLSWVHYSVCHPKQTLKAKGKKEGRKGEEGWGLGEEDGGYGGWGCFPSRAWHDSHFKNDSGSFQDIFTCMSLVKMVCKDLLGLYQTGAWRRSELVRVTQTSIHHLRMDGHCVPPLCEPTLYSPPVLTIPQKYYINLDFNFIIVVNSSVSVY